MNKRYTAENKPKFIQDELVVVDMSCFGGSVRQHPEVAKIVGKSFEHIIDTWLVEFKTDFGKIHPFKVIQVPHTFILDRPITTDESHKYNL